MSTRAEPWNSLVERGGFADDAAATIAVAVTSHQLDSFMPAEFCAQYSSAPVFATHAIKVNASDFFAQKLFVWIPSPKIKLDVNLKGALVKVQTKILFYL